MHLWAGGVRRDDWRQENLFEKSSHCGGKKKPGGTPCQPDRSARLHRRSPNGRRRWVNNGKSPSFKLFFGKERRPGSAGDFPPAALALVRESPLAGH
jgi:hypothetical protein